MFDDTGFGKEPIGDGGGRGEKLPHLIYAKDAKPGAYFVDDSKNEWNIGEVGSDENGNYLQISRTEKSNTGEGAVLRKKMYYTPKTRISVIQKY